MMVCTTLKSSWGKRWRTSRTCVGGNAKPTNHSWPFRHCHVIATSPLWSRLSLLWTVYRKRPKTFKKSVCSIELGHWVAPTAAQTCPSWYTVHKTTPAFCHCRCFSCSILTVGWCCKEVCHSCSHHPGNSWSPSASQGSLTLGGRQGPWTHCSPFGGKIHTH